MSMVKDAPEQTSEQRVGNLIRELRTRQGVSLRTLAARAGFSPSFLSQVERGQASPSIASLERLAQALGTTLGEFFRVSRAAVVTRAGERAELTSAWSHAQVEALGPAGPGHAFESMMITLDPGGQSGGRTYGHGGEEFAIVFAGDVRLTLGDDVYRLTPGDAATFSAELPHSWENVGKVPARIVVVSAH
jgi:transcriptional regulator with XRE-family HTH domain